MNRPEKRRNDGVKNLEFITSVNRGSLFQFIRNRFDKAVKHENRERQPKTDIRQNHSRIGAQQADACYVKNGAIPGQQREHHDLEWNHHRRHKDKKNDLRCPGFRANQHPCRLRREEIQRQQREKGDDDGGDERALIANIVTRPDRLHIFHNDAPVGWKRHGSLRNIKGGLGRVDNHDEKRKQIQHEQDERDDLQNIEMF